MLESRICTNLATIAICAGLAFSSAYSGRALATGIPVFDANQLVSQVESRFEFIATLNRYREQVQQWEAMLSQNPLMRIRNNANTRPKIGSQLQLREDDFGDRRCNAGGGNPVSGLLNIFQLSFDPQGNLRQEQTKLCVLEVAIENRRWNENVLMIRQMELLQEQMDSVADARSGGMTQGEIDTKFGDMQQAQAQFQGNVEDGRTRIGTYDDMLRSVRNTQAMAAEQLLKGTQPSSFLAEAANTMVQGAVLSAALRVGTEDCGDTLGRPCD